MKSNEADEVFLSYERPVRTRHTAESLINVLCFTAANAALASLAYKKNDNISIVVFSVTMVLAIVGCAILISLGWAYFTARIHTVSMSKAGIRNDDRLWPWSSVVSIQSRPASRQRRACLEVMVNQGFWRSPLALTIDSAEIEDEVFVTRLLQFLSQERPEISWR